MGRVYGKRLGGAYFRFENEEEPLHGPLFFYSGTRGIMTTHSVRRSQRPNWRPRLDFVAGLKAVQQRE